MTSRKIMAVIGVFMIFGVASASHAVEPQFASSGCGKPAPLTGNHLAETITIDGQVRTYQIIVPTDYNPAEPLPLVFGYHHKGGTTQDAASYGVATAPNAERAIYILPQGLVIRGSTGWNEACGGNDMRLTTALMQEVEANYCINTTRRFAYGFSWGADMSNSVGCCLGAKFRAIAPESGGNMGPETKTCQKPTPGYMLQYGLEDQCYSQSNFANMVADYRQLANCNGYSVTQLDANCKSYNGCGSAVISCGFSGLTHALEPNSGARIWSFFSRYE